MLLDQSAERRNLSDTFRRDITSSFFKKPSLDINIASGCPLFVARGVINKSTYVHDNIICIGEVMDAKDFKKM